MDLLSLRGANDKNNLAAAAAAVAVCVLALYSVSSQKKQERPPFSSATLFQTIRGMTGGGMHTFLIEQFQTTGHLFRLAIPGIVVVVSSEDAREMYKDPYVTKPRIMYGALDLFTSGMNIFTTNGPDWHHRRKGINPAFSPKCVKHMNTVAMLKARAWVGERLGPWSEDQQSFDEGTEMILLTISVICKAAFRYDILEHEGKEILGAMQDSFEEFSIKSMINPLRQFATWMLPKRQRAFQEAARLKAFAYKLMDLYRHSTSSDDGETDKDTVIDLIMMNDSYKDDTERASDIIMLLFAGHDTTGYTIAFTLLELAKHPEEQRKLRQELLSNSAAPYLKCVVNETMRLHPASPVSAVKELGRDFVSKDGYFVPKGTIAFLAQIALGQDPIVYQNPSHFQPSRWIDASDQAKQAHFPFSLGKRNCVGQSLATAQLNSIVAYLIRNFEFTIDEEGIIEAQGTLRLTGCRLKATTVSSESCCMKKHSYTHKHNKEQRWTVSTK